MEQSVPEEKQSGLPRPPGWGARHVVAGLGFLAMVTNYALRFNLAMAIVVMVKHSAHRVKGADGNITIVPESCAELIKPFNATGLGPSIEDTGEFEWNEAEQGLVLGSFFWGYILTQIPGGILSQKYGGKWVISIGILVQALLSFFIPTAARLGQAYLVAIRVVQGIFGGVTVPAMHMLFARWFPPEERSSLASAAYSGLAIGAAMTMVLSGYMIEAMGWESVFHGAGILGVLWFIVWTVCLTDTPGAHPRITQQEADYIERSLGAQSSKVSVATPWAKVLTSIPVLVIFIAETANHWGLYTLLQQIPTYMRTALHFDIRQNGWTSASPHLCMWLFSILLTYTVDKLIERNTFSVICMRKACNTISQYGMALALISTALAGCNRIMAVLSLNIAMGLLGGGFGGWLINIIDIAPNHAGVIMGIGNTISNVAGAGAPYVAGLILSGDTSVENWGTVFYVAAAILFVGNTFFLLFATGEEMSWNRPVSASGDLPIERPRKRSSVSESLSLPLA